MGVSWGLASITEVQSNLTFQFARGRELGATHRLEAKTAEIFQFARGRELGEISTPGRFRLGASNLRVGVSWGNQIPRNNL